MRIRIRWVTASVLLLLLAASMASAAGVEYDHSRRVFRVCNLCLPSSTTTPFTNHNPYLWIALDKSPLKPAGWTFENPLASPVVTQQMATTWEDPAHAFVPDPTNPSAPDPEMSSRSGYWLAHTGIAATAPALLTKSINKDWPQYWEVYLDADNASRLKEFDLIYISSSDLPDLPDSIRQGLMDAVKSGTTLWIDSGGVGGNAFTTTVAPMVPGTAPGWMPPISTLANAAPFSFAAPASNGTFYRDPFPAALADPQGDPDSQLYNTPYRLSMTPGYPLESGETRFLGDAPSAGVACDGYHLVLPPPGSTDQSFDTILTTRDSTGGNAPGPALATTQYGDGHILLSAINVGQDAQEWYVLGNNGPDMYQAPDVKLAYNVLAWGTTWSSTRQASAGSATAKVSALPPLDIAWQFPQAPATAAEANATKIGPVLAAPVVSHGRIYVESLISDPLSGQATPARLYCFDANPSRDLNGDGNPDDGIPDYSLGTPYDEVWQVDLGSLAPGGNMADATPRWAGPTVVDLPQPVVRANGSYCKFAVLVSFVSQDGSSNDGYVAAVDGETGTLLGGFTATPYDVLNPGASPAQVRDISTPVVRNGWVYFTCSEFDPDLVPTGSEQHSPTSPPQPQPTSASWAADGTYGRAWCIDLGQLVAPGAAPPFVWCYPDPDLDRNGVMDAPDGEAQDLLPPFAEPLWVAGLYPQDPNSSGRPRQVPPDPGTIPAITTTTRRADGTNVDAVMNLCTACGRMFDRDDPNSALRLGRSIVDYVFDPVGAWQCGPPPTTTKNPIPTTTVYQRRQGGWEFALVPTPTDYNATSHPAWDYPLNGGYYRLGAAPASAPTITAVERVDDPTIVVNTPADWYALSNGVAVIPYRARYLLSKTSTKPPYDNPLRVPMGAEVQVTYSGGATPDDFWLPGTIPWLSIQHDQERCVTAPAAKNGRIFEMTSLPDNDAAGRTVDPLAQSTSRITSQDMTSVNSEWRFDPTTEMPAGLGYADPQGRSESAVAAGRDTVAAAMTLQPLAGGTSTSSILGLRTEPDLTVTLGSYYGLASGVGISANAPVTVNLLAPRPALPPAGTLIDPSQYTVGYAQGAITFDPLDASRIRVVNPSGTPPYLAAGHIYGEPIVVGWTDTTGTAHPSDLYVVPPMTRFDYMAGFIKLRYYPVRPDSIVITTAGGLPVTGWTAGEPTVNFGGVALIPHGWVNITGATFPSPSGPQPIVPGQLLRISYIGFNDDWGFFGVGTPAVAAPASPAPSVPPEEQEAPIVFGPSASGVVRAGGAIHVGTEGYADASGNFVAPPGAMSNNDTFLSLLWDPVTNLVRGSLTATAELGAFATGPGQIAAATGSPALVQDGVVTGSRIMSTPNLGTQLGFISDLRTRETVIADANRIVRCDGQQLQDSITGTSSWEYGQDPATDQPTVLPLNHPSKAEVLPDGDLLICDTGNNRVVETDPSGRVVWPLDANGINYYSSAANTNLSLLRPSDAERYESVEDPDGAGPTGVVPVKHTVIADSGHDRIIDVLSWWVWDATALRWEQHHLVRTLSTEYLRDAADPSRRVKPHYTQVELIHDPANGAVAGYLCAAPNLSRLVVLGYDNTGALLVDPTPTTLMPDGTNTWALWSWIYANPAGTYDPLAFLGIKNLSLKRIDGVVFMDVSCLEYQGRYSDWSSGTRWWNAFTTGGFTGQDPGPGVFEFRVSYAAPMGLIASSRGPDVPVWIFAERPFRVTAPGGAPASACYRYFYDGTSAYHLRPWFNIPMAGTGTTLDKRFLPTSASMLVTGRHLISNYSGLIERMTKAALGQTGVSPGSEVFEVETVDGGDLDPANDVQITDYRRIIPNPYGADWTNPLVEPVFAERVGE